MGKKTLPVKKDRPVADITKFFDKRRFSKPLGDKPFGIHEKAITACATKADEANKEPQEQQPLASSVQQAVQKPEAPSFSGTFERPQSGFAHPSSPVSKPTSQAHGPAASEAVQKDSKRPTSAAARFKPNVHRALNANRGSDSLAGPRSSQRVQPATQPIVTLASKGSLPASQRAWPPVAEGLSMMYSQDLDLEGERVGYQSTHPICPLPAVGQDEAVLKDHFISAVSTASGKQVKDPSTTGLHLAAANSCRSQDAFFEELLLLPPPVRRCRDDTPSRPIIHKRRPSGSNLKPQSSLKPLNKSKDTASPCTSTPRLGSGRPERKQSRVTFNPSVNFAVLPTPSSCSCSGSGKKRSYHPRVKSLIGSVQKQRSSTVTKRRSYKRKSLMDLLDQVELLMQDEEDRSPGNDFPETAGLDTSDPTGASGFVRASQEIEKASQEVEPSIAKPATGDRTLPVILEEKESQLEQERLQETSTPRLKPSVGPAFEGQSGLHEEGTLPQEAVPDTLLMDRRREHVSEGGWDRNLSKLPATGDESCRLEPEDASASGLQRPPSPVRGFEDSGKSCATTHKRSQHQHNAAQPERCVMDYHSISSHGRRQQILGQSALRSGKLTESSSSQSQKTPDVAKKGGFMKSPPSQKSNDKKRARHSAPASIQKPLHRLGQENQPFEASDSDLPRFADSQPDEKHVLADVTNADLSLHPSLRRASPALASKQRILQESKTGAHKQPETVNTLDKRLDYGDLETAQPSSLSLTLPDCAVVFPPSNSSTTQALEDREDQSHLSNRFVVVDKSLHQHEVQIRAMKFAGGKEVTIHLQDGWMDTEVNKGDVVNLLASYDDLDDGTTHALCNFKQGLLILHPDLLLSGTLVSNSYKCARSSVIQENFSSSSNASAVKGTLLHELMQAAMTLEILTEDTLSTHIRPIMLKHAEKLLGVGFEEYEAEKALEQAMPVMLSWVKNFRRDSPLPYAVVSVKQAYNMEDTETFCMPEVVDIEESVWTPKYGLKGMIDATVQTHFAKQQHRATFGGPKTFNGNSARRASMLGQSKQHRSAPASQARAFTCHEGLAPFEFKTGKPWTSHRAQVMLYLLLMEERYGQPIERGLLQYLNDQPPEIVQKSHLEVSGLLMQRNMLAAHLMKQAMPGLLQDESQCSKCFQLTQCMLLHRAVEHGSRESSGIEELFDKHAGGLSDEHAAFLEKWLHLVSLESEGQVERRADMWTLTGLERENSGKCIAMLEFTPESERTVYTVDKTCQWSYEFRRCKSARTKSMLELDFSQGDLVVLSIDGRHACIARASIAALMPNAVTVLVNKKLHKGFLDPSAGMWRIDKDEVSSVFVKIRTNLLDLMASEDGKASKLRALIIDLASPKFDACLPAAMEAERQLNEEQQHAVQRITSARDYTLVQGLPGTGKTSTIAVAVMSLLAAGKSVLLTSYTNSAVDNIMLKLAEQDVSMLRLGRSEGVHPKIQPYMLGGAKFPGTGASQLKIIMRDISLVGCTALGVDSPLLKHKLFDMCVVDEAGQITLPACIAPLLKAKAFTLVGDHYQLPPLVQNKQAAEEGLAESLFLRLCRAHPQAIAQLKIQYRMAGDIQMLPNLLIYNGQLKCGSSKIQSGSLNVNPPAILEAGYPAWLQQTLQSQRRVVFLNTDSTGAFESRVGGTVYNKLEAEIVAQIVGALADGGVPLTDIAAISPYRQQVTQMQRSMPLNQFKGLEVMTVDKCQGRDKAAILLSLVRCNEEGHAGPLLADWRRLNVAMTRAKTKLILIGSVTTLASIPLLAELISFCREKNWLVMIDNHA